MKNIVALLSLVASVTAHARWITDDFVVVSRPVAPSRWRGGDCRGELAKRLCLVNPPKAGESERPCLAGGESYAPQFEALYDAYPKPLRKMFCSLRKIFVEHEFLGTAYAMIEKDPKTGAAAASIGIRQSILDQKPTLATWASWKEQLSFGGVVDSYTAKPHLPTIRTDMKGDVHDMLYFVIAHEFGHHFDFANNLNRFEDPKCGGTEGQECAMAKGSWGALAWKTDRTALPGQEFAHRAGLCFYTCGTKPLPEAAIAPLYEGIDRTSFISTYAATQPWDDFADSIAYYLIAEERGAHYAIDTKHGPSLDIVKKLYADRFRAKRDYIRNFLSRSDIVYP